MRIKEQRSLLLAPVLAAALALAGAAPAIAKAAPASPATTTLRLDPARIDRTLARMVADGRAAGASALVWKDGREVYFGTAGYADREAKRPMRRDTLVQIWSMTKPVTGTAFMQLWEQGRFGLDEPLAKYLPEFAGVKVFAGVDSTGKPILREPSRPILIRDILRHTAGFAYGDGPTLAEKMFVAANPLDLDNDLPTFGSKLATVPLLFDPGTEWSYSAAVDVQALLVEKLTGMPFESYVRQHVLDPLKMRDTAWTQPEERYGRLAATYFKGPDGKLQRQPDEVIRRANFTPRKLTMGGAGLVSSLDDYMRFARMLLNHGSLDGARILRPSTVKLMSTDQLDPRITERRWLPGKGSGGFGMDFFVRTGRPRTTAENRGAVGEFFWDGAASTLFWVDPANRLTAVFFVQSMPFDGTLHRDIRRAVYGPNYLGPKGD
jgi:CubicO group peptidase (beta-lactamase class C family)